MKHETTVAKIGRQVFYQWFGGQLWRNNTGAYEDEHGHFIRYGLCNESKEQNEKCKSSDYIGITPVVIGPEHVGMTLGVFTALETKKPGWRLIPSDKRGHAQAKFHDLVRAVGGFAGFVVDPYVDVPTICQVRTRDESR